MDEETREYRLWAYSFTGGNEPSGEKLTRAHCPQHGRLLGWVWRHPHWGLVFETVYRDSIGRHVEAFKPLEPWAARRGLAPLPLRDVTGSFLVTVGCPDGSRDTWQVDLLQARDNAIRGRGRTQVQKPHASSAVCGHVHARFVSSLDEFEGDTRV